MNILGINKQNQSFKASFRYLPSNGKSASQTAKFTPEKTEELREFLNFIQSKKGQNLLKSLPKEDEFFLSVEDEDGKLDVNLNYIINNDSAVGLGDKANVKDFKKIVSGLKDGSINEKPVNTDFLKKPLLVNPHSDKE